MKLKELVLEKAIVPSLKGVKRDECIGELLDALAKAGGFKAALKAEFQKAVVKREKKGSTGFGHGVAIPHVKTPEVQRCVVAVGLHAAGIDFNALDRHVKGGRADQAAMIYDSAVTGVKKSFTYAQMLEEAKAHAERNGWQYTLEMPKSRAVRPKAYADNFAYTRVGRWTH